MSTSPQKRALTVLIGSLLTGTAFGGAWTLYDEQESSTVAVLNSCNAQGVCNTPLNFNGDFNATTGQPVVDLAVANDFGPIRLYVGMGEQGRGFTPSYNIYDSGYQFRTSGLRFADLDNDGDVEMIHTTRGSGNYVYRFRNPDPPFYCTSATFGCENAHFTDVRLGGTAEADNSQGLAVGDLNLDCRIDVIVANGIDSNPSNNPSNKVYLNQTLGIAPGPGGACPAIAENTNPLAFGPAIPLISTGVGGDSDSREVELVDVDADGDLDAIVANADANDNWLYINNTKTTIVPAPTALFAAPVPLTALTGDDAEITFGLAVGDINGDGWTDIAVANGNNRNRYYFNTVGAALPTARFNAGSGTFGDSTDVSNAIKLADVNQDGFLDAIVTNDPGPSRVHLLQGNAGALTDYPIVLPVGLPGAAPFNVSTPTALDLAKLNDDSWPDLVIANTDNQYNLRFLNNHSCYIPPASRPSALVCDPFANAAPTITGPAGTPITGAEDALGIAITVASVTATDSDNLTADLRLAIEAGTNYTVTMASGPTPTITPAANYSGPLNVNVRVTDLTTLSAPFTLPVTVTPVPDAPTFTSTAVTTATQGTQYSYSVTTADADVGEARSISAPTKPAWLNLTDAGNGTATLSGTPGAADGGSHNVTLEVRDAANLVASQSFTITVPSANRAPSFTSTAVVTVTAGASYSYAVATSDPDTGDTRTIAATTLPTWLTLTDGGNGSATLAGTPAATNVGSHNVSLRVTDAAGATATQSFTITVAAAASNPPPSSGGGGGGGSVGLVEVLMLLAGLGAALRRRRLV